MARLCISKDLAHDAKGRADNLSRSSHVAKFLNDSGLICFASFVAPTEESREHAVSVIGKDNCYLIHLNPPLEVCKKRDPSGLYTAAETAPSADIPGVSFPYETPQTAVLELDTAALSIDECIERVIKLMKQENII
jgi:bifunctional enzyme CysN/CysC